MEKIAYNLKEACAATGCSKDRIYNALNAGELSAKRLGGRTYFMADELERWLREKPEYSPRTIKAHERFKTRREPVAA
jgi:excisionase family DNA binding protein